MRAIDPIDRIALMEKLGIGKECTVCEQNSDPYCKWKPDVVDVCEAICTVPTIEPRCETCEAFNKTRLLIPQPQQRWIPCSKELPERNLVVLVTTRWGEVTEGVKLSGNAWFIGRGEENAYDSDILAWMEKPEPYAERRADEGD